MKILRKDSPPVQLGELVKVLTSISLTFEETKHTFLTEAEAYTFRDNLIQKLQEKLNLGLRTSFKLPALEFHYSDFTNRLGLSYEDN